MELMIISVNTKYNKAKVMIDRQIITRSHGGGKVFTDCGVGLTDPFLGISFLVHKNDNKKLFIKTKTPIA